VVLARLVQDEVLANRLLESAKGRLGRWEDRSQMAHFLFDYNMMTIIQRSRINQSWSETQMSTEPVFLIHLVLGYVAWLLCLSAYILPWLKSIHRVEAQRAIATLHSFRFFGLVFIVPGVVSPHLPERFATYAAYGDFATGLLAMLALLTIRIRPVFWLFVVAFNLVGTTDLVLDYYHAIQAGLPARAGELGATYAIPIIYVPLLMITHFVAFYFLVRQPDRRAAE
jgi:hypothetical protein